MRLFKSILSTDRVFFRICEKQPLATVLALS